jgi:exonuclease SbcC
MNIKTLQLENFQAFASETIHFDTGVTLLYGANGTGKSTILRAIFAGLFQSSIRSKAATKFDGLGELIKHGESSAKIELQFESHGDEYHVAWELERNNPSGDDSTAKTAACFVDGSALDESINGVTDVQSVIQSALAGISPKSFVNTVYVQQKDLNQLITATNEERQEIFDGLLGLSTIDTYIERAVKSRRETKSHKKALHSQQTEIDSQIDSFTEDKKQLQTHIQSLRSEQTVIKENIESAQGEYSCLREKRTELESAVTEVEKLNEKQSTLTTDIASLESKEQAIEEEIEDIADKITNLQAEIYTLEYKLDSIVDFDLDTIESNHSELIDNQDALAKQQKTLQTEKTKLETQYQQYVEEQNTMQSRHDTAIQDQEVAEKKHQAVKTLIAEVETKIQELRQVHTETHEDITELLSGREELLEDIDSIEELFNIKYQQYVSRFSDIQKRREELLTEKSELHSHMETSRDTEKALESPDVLVESIRDEFTKTQITLDEIETLVSRPREFKDTLLVSIAHELPKTIETLCILINVYESLDDLEVYTRHEEVQVKLEEITESLEQTNAEYYSVKSIIDDIELAKHEYDSTILDAEAELESLESTLAEKQTQQKILQSDIETHKTTVSNTASRLKELTEDIATSKNQLENIDKELATVTESLNTTVDKLTRIEEIEELQSEYRSAKQRQETLTSQRETVLERYEDVKTQLTQKSTDLNKVKSNTRSQSKEKLQTKLTEVVDECSDVESLIDTLQSQHTEAVENISVISTNLEQLRNLQNRFDEVDDKINETQVVLSEINSLIQSYENTKQDLRSEHVSLIESHANEVFSELYQNGAYQRIHLTDEYNITLESATGSNISPTLTSGGESAIVNLALRAGIYKTLLTQSDDADTQLPPLILDEPTTYLDSNHVGQLGQFISTVNRWNMNQVIVVSHNEELIDTADTGLHITHDPKQDTSTVAQTY